MHEYHGEAFPAGSHPEAELTQHAMRDAAAFAASQIATTWHLRPTASRRDSGDEERALFSVLALERFADPVLYNLAQFPVLPESPSSHEAEISVADALAELRTELPYSDEEITGLRQQLTVWNRSDMGTWPQVSNPEHLERWSGWLRCDPLPSGRLPVSAPALKVHAICSRLYDGLKASLGVDR